MAMSETTAPVAGLMSHSGPDALRQAVVVPKEQAALKLYGYRTRRRLCQLALQLMHDPPRRTSRTLTQEEHTEVERILTALSNIPEMTPDMANILQLSDMLKIINGTAPNTKWEFPAPFPTIATNALQKYQRDNWGAREQNLVDNEATANNLAAGHPSNPSMNNRLNTVPRHAPSNHPIHGPETMRGIIVNTSGSMVKRSLDPSFPARNSKVEGHNGLSVGQWWPYQICALRDGAHGSMMAGIAGGENEGAFSILVSGGKYTDLDTDNGTTLLYTGSQAPHAPTPLSASPNEFSSGTKALQRSHQLGRWIRVLRSAKGKSVWAPRTGIRYDGLYRITEERVKRNRAGGRYVLFRLERREGQGSLGRGGS